MNTFHIQGLHKVLHSVFIYIIYLFIYLSKNYSVQLRRGKGLLVRFIRRLEKWRFQKLGFHCGYFKTSHDFYRQLGKIRNSYKRDNSSPYEKFKKTFKRHFKRFFLDPPQKIVLAFVCLGSLLLFSLWKWFKIEDMVTIIIVSAH